MRGESDRLKIYYARNEKTNEGVCVCLRDKAPKGTPVNDCVGLCIGPCNKKGNPKAQIVMTPDEACCLGEALIGARWFYIQEQNKKAQEKENQTK